jgi:Leucine-rich repeat (LRR) protein
METASKDVLFTVAMNLDLPDLLRWCQSNSKIMKDVCRNDNVWRSKLLKDFNNEYPDIQKFNLNRSLKETYVFLYQLSYIKKLLNTQESLYNIFLMKEIDLSAKGLKKVLAFDLPNLQYLDLSDNKLTKVPAFDLPNLQGLYLYDNSLTKVPAFDLPNLQILDLSHNKLTEVPAFDLPNLQTLSLSNNNLTEIPAFDLPNLHTLYLSNNNLTEIPAFDLLNLQYLYLDNNKLTEVQAFNIPNLKIFDLQNNKLTELTKKEAKEKYKNIRKISIWMKNSIKIFVLE